jgi:hypothetical protein
MNSLRHKTGKSFQQNREFAKVDRDFVLRPLLTRLSCDGAADFAPPGFRQIRGARFEQAGY